VLILGAGPAGCAAAIRAASRGLKVALVERAAFPRDLPGEALHPDVDDLFAELGVSEAVARSGYVRCPGWMLVRPAERGFIPFSGLRFGYQAWRAELDSILLARAREAGATVLQPAQAGALVLDGDRVRGLDVNGDPWLCHYLADATGSARWVSRRLRLPALEFSPKLAARYAYFRSNQLGTIPEFHEHACGWSWVGRVKDDWCQYVHLPLAAGARAAANMATPECVPPGTRFRGANVTWRLVPECAGADYFLCGDAAAVLDPAASSGVARALASGLQAADLIAQVVQGSLDDQEAAAAYRRWYAHLFIQQARQLAERYAGLDEPPAWLGGLERRFTELERSLSIAPSDSLANPAGAVITSS